MLSMGPESCGGSRGSNNNNRSNNSKNKSRNNKRNNNNTNNKNFARGHSGGEEVAQRVTPRQRHCRCTLYLAESSVLIENERSSSNNSKLAACTTFICNMHLCIYRIITITNTNITIILTSTLINIGNKSCHRMT